MKRNRRSRIRGRRTCGWAAKKHKGKGNTGGKGFSGSGKKSDQKKSYVLKYHFPYFGGQGWTSRSTKRKKEKIMNLDDIQTKFKPGEVNLPGYKILGEGEIEGKFIIKAMAASKTAREKIEKAGGKIILPERKEGIKKAELKKAGKKSEDKIKK